MNEADFEKNAQNHYTQQSSLAARGWLLARTPINPCVG
jgi:hypothetical protein